MQVTKGRNTYCGPAALSIITGHDTDETARVLRYVSGKRAIRGVSNNQMLQALTHYGYHTAQTYANHGSTKHKPTLARWIREYPRESDAVYLVLLTRHYVVIRGRKLADNRNHNSVFLGAYTHRRTRVHRVWKVWGDKP